MQKAAMQVSPMDAEGKKKNRDTIDQNRDYKCVHNDVILGLSCRI